MNELAVYNACSAYLAAEGFSIVQLVAPGGQCPKSLTIRGGESRRTVFPDLIAVKDQTVFVGEMKARFSKPDYLKLVAIIEDLSATRQLQRLSGLDDHALVRGVLCHSQKGAGPVQAIDQWVFSPTDPVQLVPPLDT